MKKMSKKSQNYVDGNIILQEVLDCLPIHIFWKDKNSCYLGCNQLFAEAAGLRTPEEIIGLNDYQLPWSNNAEHFQKYDRKVMDSGEAILNIREPQVQNDGIEHWLETNKMALKNDNNDVIGILGAYRDVTDQIQLEKENIKNEKLETLSQLAGTIAHDFNNSLAIMNGLLSLAEKKINDPFFLQGVFNKMRKAVQNSEKISKKFISFAKEEQQFLSMMDISHFFKENHELLATGTRMRINIDNKSSTPKIIFDEGLFFQLINNIVTNASQASRKSNKFE